MEIRVPQLPESVADAVVASWLKKEGEFVKAEEPLLELETDKVVLEVTSPASGILTKVIIEQGETVIAEQLLAELSDTDTVEQSDKIIEPPMSPSVRQSLAEHALDYHNIEGSGKKGRILKEDINGHIDSTNVTVSTTSKQQTSNEQISKNLDLPKKSKMNATTPSIGSEESAQLNTTERPQKRVPMTRLRQRIAERLVAAQQNAAILTTFNEVDLGEIKRMRQEYQARFQAKHGIKMGFMSFFAKACTEALKRFPEVNARISGDEIVYHGYYDIGMAVSTERGLVVPIIKDVDQLSYAEIEMKIVDYAERARNNRLDIEELKGGTFSISNGGVFGSMLSTPILNPPQSAILGMHKIEDRPVVVNGEIVIRPMMYLALSYDHRLIDGKTAVSFLIKIKELLEDPASLLLEL